MPRLQGDDALDRIDMSAAGAATCSGTFLRSVAHLCAGLTDKRRRDRTLPI